MMAWFGLRLQDWPDESVIPFTRQYALERATRAWLADLPVHATCWLRIAETRHGDDSDDLEIGGEA
jgi:hypothetical protein